MTYRISISLWWNHGEPDEMAFPDAPEMGKDPHAQDAMRYLGISYTDYIPSQ